MGRIKAGRLDMELKPDGRAANRGSCRGLIPRTVSRKGRAPDRGGARRYSGGSGRSDPRASHPGQSAEQRHSLHESPAASVHISAEAPENARAVPVRDTGRGHSEGIACRVVFERFFRVPGQKGADGARDSDWPSSRKSWKRTAAKQPWKAAKARAPFSPSPCGARGEDQDNPMQRRNPCWT